MLLNLSVIAAQSFSEYLPETEFCEFCLQPMNILQNVCIQVLFHFSYYSSL